MNEYEARLAIQTVIRDVLLDLSEEPLSPDETELMGDVADMILEALELEVVGVNDPTVACHVSVAYLTEG